MMTDDEKMQALKDECVLLKKQKKSLEAEAEAILQQQMMQIERIIEFAESVLSGARERLDDRRKRRS